MVSRLRAESTYRAEVRLESTLLRHYRKAIRPVLQDKDNVTIQVGMSLNNIKSMDDKNQILTLSLWLRQRWNDPRLVWEPSNYSSTKAIHISPKKLWVPDLKVYNEVNRQLNDGLDQIQTRAIVLNYGDVLWMAPYILQLSCQVNLKYFPYDKQICKVKIGSWTYHGLALDVKPENMTMDVSKSDSNAQWRLVSTNVKRNVQTYPCCPEPFPDITYTITIERRLQSYWMNFLYPGMFLTTLTMMAFISPASDTGERVGLVLTSLVSMFIFLKMVAERTPSSDVIPLLSIFFVMLSFEILLIFYSVCFSINTYHKNPSMGEMPGYIRTLILEKFGRLWGLRGQSQAISSKLEALGNKALMKDRILAQLEAMKTAVSSSKTSSETPPRNLCKCIATCPARKLEISVAPVALNQCRNSNSEFPEATPLVIDATTTPEITHQGINPRSDLSHKDKTSNQRPNKSTRQRLIKISNSACTCTSFLRRMVMTNARLLSSIREIVYVARVFDKTSTEKEHWLVAASILDRAFLILFVLMFLVITLVFFLW